jgi:hypothetical protein
MADGLRPDWYINCFVFRVGIRSRGAILGDGLVPVGVWFDSDDRVPPYRTAHRQIGSKSFLGTIFF